MADMTEPLQVAAAPCKSCPYRRDVPSGVWAREEYDKLPRYDGEIFEQAMQGASALFHCHQRDGRLCAGWVATHGADNLLAMRLNASRVEPSVWEYRSPCPVFASGREAADHGKRSIRHPGADARRVIARLEAKAERREKASNA
jgi:hypothetical protein